MELNVWLGPCQSNGSIIIDVSRITIDRNLKVYMHVQYGGKVMPMGTVDIGSVQYGGMLLHQVLYQVETMHVHAKW